MTQLCTIKRSPWNSPQTEYEIVERTERGAKLSIAHPTGNQTATPFWVANNQINDEWETAPELPVEAHSYPETRDEEYTQ